MFFKEMNVTDKYIKCEISNINYLCFVFRKELLYQKQQKIKYATKRHYQNRKGILN